MYTKYCRVNILIDIVKLKNTGQSEFLKENGSTERHTVFLYREVVLNVHNNIEAVI